MSTKALRKKFKLSQIMLADILKVSVHTVRAWEQKKRTISQSHKMLIGFTEQELSKKKVRYHG